MPPEAGDGDQAPDAAAAAWFARRRGTGGHDEAAFIDWLGQDPAHREAYEAVTRAWALAGMVAWHPEVCSMRAEALSIYQRPRPGLRRLAAAAAAVLAIGVASAPLLLEREHGAPPRRTGATAAAPRLIQTVVGERSVTTLDDGSVVTLDTNSRISVSYAAHRRSITLLAGQALFQVAKDAARPFVVTAANREVVATGTEFNVRLAAADLRVTLLDGHVNVLSTRPAGSGGTTAVARLAPGEQLVATSSGQTSIAPADLPDVASWREGRVHFNDTALAEAVAEMNRYTVRPILIADPALAGLRISGTFRTGRPQDFVDGLAAYFRIAVDLTPDAIRLRSAGEARR